MNGILTLVGTPLGNLGDITDRARETLAAADLVLCEDTRRTGGLISKLGFTAPPMLVANEHTEHGVIPKMLSALADGQKVVLATDAPLSPVSLRHLARRAALGVGRGGSPGGTACPTGTISRKARDCPSCSAVPT